MCALLPPSLESIHSARERLAGTILRTPLIRLNVEDLPAEIYLKLDNLQPTGSFKVRGAGNALLSANPDECRNGVWTASAGNMGQALAWYAKKLNVHCSVLVPEDAPEVKVQAIRRLGAEIVKVSFVEYQSVQKEGAHPAMKGLLIHPFANEAVMAGHGTLGLEILEDLPEVDTILVPYGGGGLSCGIAASLAAQSRVRVEAVEVATAAPLSASLVAGKMIEVAYQMWPLASRLLAGSRVVELRQVADALRLLVERHHIIVEGAGAVALAAALAIKEYQKVVCVVSGGNINTAHLTKILHGELP
jgi:threonine dehydratase